MFYYSINISLLAHVNVSLVACVSTLPAVSFSFVVCIVRLLSVRSMSSFFSLFVDAFLWQRHSATYRPGMYTETFRVVWHGN